MVGFGFLVACGDGVTYLLFLRMPFVPVPHDIRFGGDEIFLLVSTTVLLSSLKVSEPVSIDVLSVDVLSTSIS